MRPLFQPLLPSLSITTAPLCSKLIDIFIPPRRVLSTYSPKILSPKPVSPSHPPVQRQPHFQLLPFPERSALFCEL